MGRTKWVVRKVRKFRAPHRNYAKGSHRDTVEAVFFRLLSAQEASDENHWGLFTALAEQTGIPQRTISNWYGRIAIDPCWRPWSSNIGRHKAIFTPSEERAIAQFIREEILPTGCIFQDVDFKMWAMSAWWEKYRSLSKLKNFNCSAGYIYSFKRRFSFSSKKVHYKRRPNVDLTDERKWTERIRKLLEEVDHERILNTDETSWLLWPRGVATWCPVNEDQQHTIIRGDEKENLTALATITASGRRLPLFVLAKGKTDRVERSQIGEVSPHWVGHSASGWMTECTFEEYLDRLRAEYPDNDWIHLLLDSYSCHRTNEIKQYAANRHIKLYFIPPGMTDRFQPLDRKVFGVLKAYAKQLFLQKARQFINTRRTKRDAVEDLIIAWDMLQETALESAWDIYF